jgi:isoleucyl-tRNA synthetase
VLAEDGRQMHKSSGNSIEFNEAADKMGVDVARWLYLTQKPENDLLFGFHRADETRRGFLLPLWNAYSFFVTYANLDGWTPRGSFDPEHPEGAAPGSENRLDRCVLSRVNRLVAVVTANLEESDFMDATTALGAFIDDLTNWYIRRSRRRFWKSEHDSDKNDAYATLYYVLVRLARLMAPITPFVTEAMYQNLVRSARPEAYESVHHTAWPKEETGVVDEDLLDQMALARTVASLGLAARSANNLKVRQPLARAMAYAGSQHSLSPELVEIVTDELNVKAFEFVEQAGQLVNYRVLPDNKVLGPRYGSLFPKVRAALSALDPAALAVRVSAGEPVVLTVDGQTVELAASEVLVHTSPVEGLAVVSDKGITVGVDATLTPELKAEGLARELVRRVQDMRKKAGFNIDDRIVTYYQAENPSPLLQDVLANWTGYLCGETLTVELVNAQPPEGAFVEAQQLESDTVTLGVKRAGK